MNRSYASLNLNLHCEFSLEELCIGDEKVMTDPFPTNHSTNSEYEKFTKYSLKK